MGRVIRTESPSRQRTQLMQASALALRTLAGLAPSELTTARDLLAFLALALAELHESVEATAAAWEKRDYWLKADRFRGEWRWAPLIGARLDQALRADDLAAAQSAAADLASALSGVALPARMAASRPWQGAWERWTQVRSGA